MLLYHNVINVLYVDTAGVVCVATEHTLLANNIASISLYPWDVVVHNSSSSHPSSCSHMFCEGDIELTQDLDTGLSRAASSR